MHWRSRGPLGVNFYLKALWSSWLCLLRPSSTQTMKPYRWPVPGEGGNSSGGNAQNPHQPPGQGFTILHQEVSCRGVINATRSWRRCTLYSVSRTKWFINEIKKCILSCLGGSLAGEMQAGSDPDFCDTQTDTEAHIQNLLFLEVGGWWVFWTQWTWRLFHMQCKYNGRN